MQPDADPRSVRPAPAPGATTDAVRARAIGVLDAALRAAGVTARELAPTERGFQVEVAGWPLDVGVRAVGVLLLAQAQVVGPGRVDPHELLHDHRRRPFARFSHAACGTVWVEAELPLAAVTPELVDAMLGALLDAAALARARAAAPR